MIKVLLVIHLLLVPVIAIAQQTVIASPSEKTAMAIYNDGISVVSEKRQVTTEKGDAHIILPGLPEMLDPASLSANIDGKPIGSIWIRQGRISPQTLLKKSLGKNIVWLVSNPETGSERAISGKLISIDGGVILDVDGRIEVMPTHQKGRLALDDLPPGILDGTEAIIHTTATRGKKTLRLRYTTTGVHWASDYEAQLANDDKSLELIGRYNLNNNTDMAFSNTRLRLVAGQPKRLAPPRQKRHFNKQARGLTAESAVAFADAAIPEQATLGDVHVYDLAESIDLPAGQIIRKRLIGPVSVPVSKIYQLNGNGNVSPHYSKYKQKGLRPNVLLRFKNKIDGEIARALPAGNIRVYGSLPKDDADSPNVILGSARLPHLPVGETATLEIGQAFDVTAERHVVDYKITGDHKNKNLRPYQAQHEITFKNGRKQAATVEIIERFSGRQYKIVKSSVPSERKDAGETMWTLTIPANNEKKFSYTVQVTP